MTAKKYSDLRKKYGSFVYPAVTLQVGGRLFSENKHQLVLSDIEAELSCGLEASTVTYSIYNVYDLEKGCYEFAWFKEYVQLGSAVVSLWDIMALRRSCLLDLSRRPVLSVRRGICTMWWSRRWTPRGL